MADQTGKLSAATLEWLSDHTVRAGRVLGCAGDVRISVVSDAEMANAHFEYMGVEGTTDVLTFDLNDPAEHPAPAQIDAEMICAYKDRVAFGLDTDIMICIDEAARQAAGRGYAVEKELLLYVVHGLLHCLGWDDHDEAEAARMHRLEDAVLGAIGVGVVFGTDAGAPGA